MEEKQENEKNRRKVALNKQHFHAQTKDMVEKALQEKMNRLLHNQKKIEENLDKKKVSIYFYNSSLKKKKISSIINNIFFIWNNNDSFSFFR